MGAAPGDNDHAGGAARTFIYVICVLQLVVTAERQIFDFLGYMWLPILVNFFNIVFVILLVFGVHESKRKYVWSYCLWTVVWIAWNIFVLCFYLQIGGLDRTQDLLSFGTGSFSWWLANGFGCVPEFFQGNATDDDSVSSSASSAEPQQPFAVHGCLLEYYHVESVHAGIHLALAVPGLLAAIVFSRTVARLKAVSGSKSGNDPIYAIEFSSPAQLHSKSRSSSLSRRGGTAAQASLLQQETDFMSGDDVRPHMTPRRVKRRSYTRSSSRSLNHKSSAGGNTGSNRRNRASTRSNPGTFGRTAKAALVNPVNRLMDVPRAIDSSTSNDEVRSSEHYGQINPAYDSSRPTSIYSMAVNGHAGAADGGHNGLVAGSRPPSSLTSYSNFHGQRRPLVNPNPGIVLMQESFKAVSEEFDDLPPPPPPIATDVSEAPPPPVPRQRNPGGKSNEYVNMPVSSHSSVMNGGGMYNGTMDFSNMQTLRVNEPLRPPPPMMTGLRTGSRQSNGTNGSNAEDDYGFSGPASRGAGSRAYPQQPVLNGGGVHAGNCSCFKCQRKLTAI